MAKRGRKKAAEGPSPQIRATGDQAAGAECETADLLQENENLRKELAQVLANASENEKIWRHFAAVQRILFRTRELERLIEELLREIRDRFQTGLVVLFISHPEAQERLFHGKAESSSGLGEQTWISPLEGESVRSLFDHSLKPALFSTERNGYPAFLKESGHALRSGALIPLNINEVLFGALLLGSSDPERYYPEDGTDLLEQLGTNIALSMDNCLTYEKVQEFAVRDQLTGLFNFFQIHSVLEKEFRKARRSGSPLSVLVVDLNFVHDWDELGSGMEVLKHAAGLLEGILPREGCYIGRYGSDEFLAVLPAIPEEEAREVIPYISATMRKSPYREGNTAILITTTIGVGALAEGMICAQDLVDAAYAELCAMKTQHLTAVKSEE